LSSAWPKLVTLHISTKFDKRSSLGHQVGRSTSVAGFSAVISMTA
jgi:hypothetical protein